MTTSEQIPPAAQPRPRTNPGKRRKSTGALWNVLTIVVLLGTLVFGILAVLIYINPYLPLNPFPPPTLPVLAVLPSGTPTPEGMLPPTETPTSELTHLITPTGTPSPTPTETLTPTATFLPPPLTVSPSPTLRPTATLGGYAFVPQEGSPDAIPYSIYSDVGCNYMGVGGRVLGLDGSPVTPGVIVRLSGTLDGRRVNMDTLSGTVTEFGESGFGFQLADHPIASNGGLYVQLLDQSYLPMSDRIYFNTYDTCDRNLIFITFRQVR